MPVSRIPPHNAAQNTSLTRKRKRDEPASNEDAVKKKLKTQPDKSSYSLQETILHKYPKCKGWSRHKIKAYIRQVDPELLRSFCRSVRDESASQEVQLGNRVINHDAHDKKAEKLLLSQQTFDGAMALRKQTQNKSKIALADKKATDQWQKAHQIDASKQNTFDVAGHGAVGIVEYSAPSEGGPITVRKKSKYIPQEDESNEFEQEFNVLKDLHHPNIIKVIASLSKSDKDRDILYMQEGGAPLSLLIYGKKLVDFNLEGINKTSTPVAELETYKESAYLDIIWGKLQNAFYAWTSDEQDIHGVHKKKTSGGPLTVKLIQNISTQVLEALSYLHEQGIVHKDIKTDNILIKPDGTVKIIDFGEAKSVQVYKKEPLNQCSGTHDYISPEAINRTINIDSNFPNTCNETTDIYAAGCVMCLLATGKKYNSNHAMNLKYRLKELYHNAVDRKDELQKTMKQNLEAKYPDKKFAQKNKELLDLLCKMLEPNPIKRISAKEALKHSFFLEETPG